MPNTLNCTAGTIATPNPAYRNPTDTAGDTLAWLETNDYDSAPVYADNSPVGYITIDTLQDATEDTPLDELYLPLTIDVIIAADASFDTVLDALYDRPFYYLADRNTVTGILTRADLNTEPVYQHLYTHLSRLEHTLRDCIQTHAPDWQDTTPLNPEILENIHDRHEEAAQSDVALDPPTRTTRSATTRRLRWVNDTREPSMKPSRRLGDCVS